MLLLAALSGCVTQRRCLQKFPPRTDTVTVVEIRDSLVYKDTVIFVRLPGELRTDSVFIPCPPPPPAYIPDTARAETSLAIARAWWDHPNIMLSLTQKDTTIEHRLDSAIKESYHWRNEYTKVTRVISEKYVPKIYKDALSICIFMFVAAGIWLGLKLRRLAR